MSLQFLQVLMHGMPNSKSNILNKKVSREEYIMQILTQFLQRILIKYAPIIKLSAMIMILILIIIICFKLGISCVESGALRNFINGGGL